jgi:hypothetical protein
MPNIGALYGCRKVTCPPITEASGITTMDKLIDKAVRMGVHSAFAPIFRLCG